MNKIGCRDMAVLEAQLRWQLFPAWFPQERGLAAFLESWTGKEKTELFLNSLPEIERELQLDLTAALEGDPAAESPEEVLLCYPGFRAVMLYRVAHGLDLLGIRLLPRMITEYAHSVTGIDIHPGARIGSGFFIDHGTGVVIGETAVMGKNVKLYQGVTLGSLTTQPGRELRNTRRHPTLEDGVTVYANATVLGGDTVIGRGSIIGAHAFVTASVPPGSKVRL